MSRSIDARSAAWQPPPRPDWVAAINREGDGMDIRSIVPLDEASLFRAAERNTGLSDYGDDDWREAFGIIVRGLERDADLNLMGRLMCRSDLLIFLEARLRIEETYKRHPEIEDQVIERPMLIIGQGRTGTSVLQNLLAAIPGNGTVKTWEAMFPCPPPEAATYLTDIRIARADHLTKQQVRVTPTLGTMHEFAGEIPTECVQFMALGFISVWFTLFGQIPEYSDYLLTRANWDAAYRYHRRVLKLLQWKNPRKHWVLKTPEHLGRIPEILRVYPDACFIWTHRDPIATVSSSTSLTGTLYWVRSDNPTLEPGKSALEKYHHADVAVKYLEQPIEWLEKGILPKDRLCNIQYRDFMKDPLSVIETIYRHFRLPFDSATRDSVARFMTENPRHARPPHDYFTGSKEQVQSERELFRRYQSYFSVPNEIA